MSEGVLLLALCEGLEGWEEAVAAGADALAELQRTFAALEPAETAREAPRVMGRLEQLAPSFRLSQFVGRLAGEAPEPPELGARMHAAHAALQQALLDAGEQLGRMQEAAERLADAALAEALPEPPNGPPPEPPSPRSEGAHEAPQAVSGAGGGRKAGPGLEPCDLALLAAGVVSSMRRDLGWMEAAAASISLGSSAEELDGLAAYWSLQPFTDERPVAALRAAAGQQAAAG